MPDELMLKTAKPSTSKWRWVVPCLCLAVLLMCANFAYNMYGNMGPFFKGDAMSTLGKTEIEARQIMKIKPSFVLTPDEVRKNGINTPWAGMNFDPIPTHPVHKRVLLYMKGWWAAYIFIGTDGKVEDVELAAT